MAPEVWLTASELATLGLPDWPTSAFNMRARLAKLGTPSRIREGSRGGGGREYELAALPVAVRRAWLQHQVASAPALPAPEAHGHWQRGQLVLTAAAAAAAFADA